MVLPTTTVKENVIAVLPTVKALFRTSHSFSTNSIILFRKDWSGSESGAALKLSFACAGFEVAGMTQVTAGLDTINFKKNSLQLFIPYSFAHEGNSLPLTLLNNLPSPKGRLINVATP